MPCLSDRSYQYLGTPNSILDSNLLVLHRAVQKAEKDTYKGFQFLDLVIAKKTLT